MGGGSIHHIDITWSEYTKPAPAVEISLKLVDGPFNLDCFVTQTFQ